MATATEKLLETGFNLTAIFRRLSGGHMKPINILVTGKTGTGKSSIINSIVGKPEGKDVAEEGKKLDGVTNNVECFNIWINEVTFQIWDSPGLQEMTNEDATVTDKIKNELRQKCHDLHLLLYCIRMDRDRLERSEIQAMFHLTDVFSVKIWETAVFVLTFANRVLPPQDKDNDKDAPIWFAERVYEFKDEISKILMKAGMDPAKAANVPVVPTGYHTITKSMPNPRALIDRDDWFNPFWYICADTMQENALVSLIASQQHRIKVIKQTHPSCLDQPLQMEYVPKKHEHNDQKSSDQWHIQIPEKSGLLTKFKRFVGKWFNKIISFLF